MSLIIIHSTRLNKNIFNNGHLGKMVRRYGLKPFYLDVMMFLLGRSQRRHSRTQLFKSPRQLLAMMNRSDSPANYRALMDALRWWAEYEHVFPKWYSVEVRTYREQVRLEVLNFKELPTGELTVTFTDDFLGANGKAEKYFVVVEHQFYWYRGAAAKLLYLEMSAFPNREIGLRKLVEKIGLKYRSPSEARRDFRRALSNLTMPHTVEITKRLTGWYVCFQMKTYLAHI